VILRPFTRLAFNRFFNDLCGSNSLKVTRMDSNTPKTKQYSEPSAGRDRILKFKEVSARVGLSRSHVHQLVTVNKFPKPFKFHEAGRSNGWLESEIDEWIETRVAASRAKGSNHA